MRLKRALDEYYITGVDTTIPFHQKLLEYSDITNGVYDIQWLDRLRSSEQNNSKN